MSAGPQDRPVLILTNCDDQSAALVRTELSVRGVPCVSIDTSDFPTQLEFEATLGDAGWAGSANGIEGELALRDIRAIYYRRPRPFAFPSNLSQPELEFVDAEARAGFFGVLAALPCPWINSPESLNQAAYKPLQLSRAAALGLRPPASVITNRPDQARAFIANLDGPALYKPLGRDLTPDPNTAAAPATRLVTANEIEDSIRMTQHLFQEFLPKAYDVRITVVGERLFAVAIHAGSEISFLDWRTDYEALTYSVVDVPNAVRSLIIELLQGLSLSFAALDFTVTRTGEWRFLEINANGQWLWLQNELGLPIAEALAAELETGRPLLRSR